ncbi:MAG: TonB-dependent receptor [Bryobacteraceae bacterium]
MPVSISLAALIVCTPRVNAQAVAVAEVDGVVTDSTAKVMVGANVTIIETDKHTLRNTVTDSTGRYFLPNLPVGPYRLEVRSPGFKDYVRSGLVLQVGSNIQINVTMQVGAVVDTIEVHANASMVETKENSVSQVIDEQRINDLPLNGRQATQLILLSGASVNAPGGGMTGSKNFYNSTTISVGGGQANGTAYLLDGGDNTDTMTNVNLPFPFPDALQEFSVETSALSAAFGTHPGATVNVVTKSGSNALHGDVFEYLRNGDVNARPFFATKHDGLKRNQFGGTLGGKIIRDKLFFFGGYQGTRNRSQPPTTISYVPTTAALNGDFSGLASGPCQSGGIPLTIVDPASGQPFPGNQIPVSRFNPASVKLATGYLPTTNDPCGKVLYGIPTTGDEDQVIGRIDWIQNEKHTVFGRYFFDDYSNPSVYDGKDLLTTTQPGNLERAQSVTLGDTYAFGPATLNSFHATFTRRRDNRGPAANQISPATLGIDIYSRVPNFLLASVSNAFSVGCGTCAPGHFNVNSYQAADDINLIRGRHQIAMGVNFLRTQDNLISGFNENGTFTFNGSVTTSAAIPHSGLSLADFLLGRPSDFGQTNPTPDDLRATIFGLYIQDTFHVNSRLTLNAGLRWEPTLPDTDKYGRGTYFSNAAFTAGQISTVHSNAPVGLAFYGDKGIPKSLWNRNLKAFGPRLGLVWNPHGDGRDTLRVGSAILYDHTELFFNERETTNPPYGSSIDIPTPAGGFINPYLNFPGGSPFPPNGTATFPPAGVYINMPLTSHPTYVAQWNVTYQRQFAGNWLASATYLGNKTTHLWVGSEINPAVYIPGTCAGKPCSTTSNTNQRRVLYLQNPVTGASYASINQADEGSNSHYEAMLLSVQHRFSHNYTVLSNYTYSNCVTDLDFTGELGSSPNSVPFNRGADRGPCDFDVRHVFNTSLVASSSWKGGALASHLLSNWRLAPIIRATSGGTQTVTTGKDNSLTGLNNDRPLQVLLNPYPANQGPHDWINPSAFVPNPLGTFGNVGRDALRAPGVLNFDLALSRVFAIQERYRLEARFEAFNAINHANFNGPNTNIASSTFGTITGTADPRILQFALKLHF